MRNLNLGAIIFSVVLALVGLTLVIRPLVSGKDAKFARDKYIGLTENLPQKYHDDVEKNMVDVVLNNEFTRAYKFTQDSLKQVQVQLQKKADSLFKRRKTKMARELEVEKLRLDTVMTQAYNALRAESLSATDEKRAQIAKSIKDTLTMEKYYSQLVSNKLGIDISWNEFEDRRVQKQDTKPFMLAGFSLIIVAILVLLYANNVLSFNQIGIVVGVGAVLLILTIVLSNSAAAGVNKVVRFEEQSRIREMEVREKLSTLRDAQKKYKKYNDRFAPSFDSLRVWLYQDSVEMKKAIQINDSTTEETITMVPAIEEVFPADKYPNLDFESLIFVPFASSDTLKFNFQASSVNRNGVDVPVFEISTLKKNYLEDIMLENFDEKSIIKIGDLEKPSYNGNWGE